MLESEESMLSIVDEVTGIEVVEVVDLELLELKVKERNVVYEDELKIAVTVSN